MLEKLDRFWIVQCKINFNFYSNHEFEGNNKSHIKNTHNIFKKSFIHSFIHSFDSFIQKKTIIINPQTTSQFLILERSSCCCKIVFFFWLCCPHFCLITCHSCQENSLSLLGLKFSFYFSPFCFKIDDRRKSIPTQTTMS